MISFTLNDTIVTVHGDTKRSLLTWLRNEQGLVAAKDGCSGKAACGACLVEVNGKACLACVTPLEKLENAQITTLEGMNPLYKNLLARAFVGKGAVQCGFCTPGFLNRAKILLCNNSDPTRDEIVKAVRPHLCRCTGYHAIVDAIMDAAKALRENPENPSLPLETSPSIGKSFPKIGGFERATGTRPFINDIAMDDMLYGALLFSPFPRAKIHRIDTTKALEIEGVVRVLTAHDIPGKRVLGLYTKDWPVMVKEGEITRYIGDVLACVVARNEETARKALHAIHVDAEELEGIFDMEQAESSPIVIHEQCPDNVMLNKRIKRGKLGDEYPPHDKIIDEVIASCVHVAEATFITPQIEHAFLETEASLAYPVRTDNDMSIHVYTQAQGIWHDKDDLVALLGLPKDKVQVTLIDSGGAFGGKEDLACQPHAALACYHTKRPVKVCLTREESLRMHPKRHAMRLHYILACDADGKIKALKARILADTGAYASAGGPVVTRTGTHASGAYFVPHVDIQVKAVFTNNVPAGAFRGFGVNQSNIAMECLLDELCLKGGFDRWQMRYDNALDTGLIVTTGQVLDGNIALKETLLAVKDVFNAHPRAGIACAIKNAGIGNGIPEPCTCYIDVMPNGTLTLHHAWTEMGQGINTIAYQMLYEGAKLPKDTQIHISSSTASGAIAGATTASRGTFQLGHAVLDAATKLKIDLEEHGSLTKLTGRRYEGRYDTNGQTSEEGAPGIVRNHIAYSFATHVVCMDEQGRVERVIAAHDSGRVINKALYDGQICGGVAMGLGYALSEEFCTKDGQLVTKTLRDCKLLRSTDMPPVDIIAIEKPDTTAPFGAKGLGEIACIPTTAATINAAFMVDGKRRYKLPIYSTTNTKETP